MRERFRARFPNSLYVLIEWAAVRSYWEYPNHLIVRHQKVIHAVAKAPWRSWQSVTLWYASSCCMNTSLIKMDIRSTRTLLRKHTTTMDDENTSDVQSLNSLNMLELSDRLIVSVTAFFSKPIYGCELKFHGTIISSCHQTCFLRFVWTYHTTKRFCVLEEQQMFQLQFWHICQIDNASMLISVIALNNS